MQINSYRNSNFAANTARKVPAFFRNAAGIPIRFGIWGLISMGVLSAALTKCTTAIFGKSYDAMKQDERKADKKKQEKFLKEDLNQRLYDTQKAKQFGRQPGSPSTASSSKYNDNKGYKSIQQSNSNTGY